jgi:hypothetical protein
MLFSPDQIHSLLESLLSVGAAEGNGLHTAMLLIPQGQLIACATASYAAHEDSTSTGDLADLTEEGNAEGLEDEGEVDDEPYLDAPERLRLLSGLASQWDEDESPRVECEVRPIP